MFIVVKKDRVWLGSDQTAQPFPSEVTLLGDLASLTIADTKCQISSASDPS